MALNKGLRGLLCACKQLTQLVFDNSVEIDQRVRGHAWNTLSGLTSTLAVRIRPLHVKQRVAITL